MDKLKIFKKKLKTKMNGYHVRTKYIILKNIPLVANLIRRKKKFIKHFFCRMIGGWRFLESKTLSKHTNKLPHTNASALLLTLKISS